MSNPSYRADSLARHPACLPLALFVIPSAAKNLSWHLALGCVAPGLQPGIFPSSMNRGMAARQGRRCHSEERTALFASWPCRGRSPFLLTLNGSNTIWSLTRRACAPLPATVWAFRCSGLPGCVRCSARPSGESFSSSLHLRGRPASLHLDWRSRRLVSMP